MPDNINLQIPFECNSEILEIVNGKFNSVLGGNNNDIYDGSFNIIGGGYQNTLEGQYNVIAGGTSCSLGNIFTITKNF